MGVLKEISITDWNTSFHSVDQTSALNALEQGKIILCPQLEFSLSAEEQRFLSPRFADKKAKNISYLPICDQLNGTISLGEFEQFILKSMIKRFATNAENLIKNLFPRYYSALKIGRTSYRPVEIEGRKASYRKDDTRLHVDAFPSAPNQGWRILRVFTNINPHQPRIWRIGEPFEDVAKRFLPWVRKPWPGSAALLKALRITKSYRTLYDHTMLQIHNLMKADDHYQKNCQQITIPFAPGNTWIVQTDHVSHAAMSGQYVLEQTFYLPVHAMQNAMLSPLKILERMRGLP